MNKPKFASVLMGLMTAVAITAQDNVDEWMLNGRPECVHETAAGTAPHGRHKIGSQATAALKAKGVKMVPVVLVAFSDLAFSAADLVERDADDNIVSRTKGTDEEVNAFYQKFCNGTMDGSLYRDHGSYGSIRDYFVQQSDSIFLPEFVVIGPVTLDKGHAHYGANNGNSKDINFSQFRNEAIAKFKEMIGSSGGKYSASQLQSAAQELFRAKEWALAEQGYAAALAKADPGDTSLRARISLGRARALVSRESWAGARAALEEYIRENPRSASVVEAYELLCKSCVQASLSEDSAEARNNLFASAVKAVTAMRPYKNGPAEALDLQLQIGSVMQAQATVEAEKGDKATAEDLLRKAAGHYMKLVMSADFSDAALRPGLQKVYVRAIRTLAATKKYNDGSPVWETVKELCETYMEKFPQGEEILEVRKALSDANIAMATGG